MHTQRRGYVAYLLRLWQVREQSRWSWHASLERAGSGARKGFASLDDLFAFLREQTDTVPGPVPDREASEDESQPKRGAPT